jgi:hypothetical protein
LLLGGKVEEDELDAGAAGRLLVGLLVGAAVASLIAVIVAAAARRRYAPGPDEFLFGEEDQEGSVHVHATGSRARSVEGMVKRQLVLEAEIVRPARPLNEPRPAGDFDGSRDVTPAPWTSPSSWRPASSW